MSTYIMYIDTTPKSTTTMYWNAFVISHGDEVGTFTVPTLFKATRCVQNTAFGMLSTNCIWYNNIAFA